jgi:hypothetical protein
VVRDEEIDEEAGHAAAAANITAEADVALTPPPAASSSAARERALPSPADMEAIADVLLMSASGRPRPQRV